VVLITTKRAKKGKTQLSYSTYIGYQTPTNQPKAVDALTYLDYINDDATKQQYLANPGNTDLYPNTDWIDLLFSESGYMQNHSVALSGGNESIRTRATISYQEQNGNIPNFGYERVQGRTNTDFKVSDKLDVSVDLNFRRAERTSSRAGSGVSAAYRQPAIFPAIFSDGSYALPSTGGNPIAGTRLSGVGISQSNYFRALVKASYRPIPELTISATYSPEHAETYGTSYAPRYKVVEFFGEPPVTIGGSNNEIGLSNSNSRSFTDNFFATAQFKKDFQKHSVSLLTGYEFIKNKSTSFSAGRFGFSVAGLEVLNAGEAENDSNSGSAGQNGLESIFGRLNYSFDNKYLFEFVIRSDASSRFSKENRVGIFPSFSTGWRISEENFMKSGFFTNLKLKASWGQLGNQNIGSEFPYTSLVAIGNGHYINGEIQQTAAQATLANLAISWETAEKTNIGIEYGILDNRLSGSIEYYRNKTNDILNVDQLSLVAGLDNPRANSESLQNTGIDFEINWEDKIGDNFSYYIGGNFATVKNEVTKLAGADFRIGGSSITQVGKPLASIYGYESLGLFSDQAAIDAAPSQFGTLTPGDIQFKDQLTIDSDNDGIFDEADGVINNDDRVIIGNSYPSLTYSFNFGFEYKKIDFSLSTVGVANRDVYLSRNLVQPLFNAGNIFEFHVQDSWTPENLGARLPVIKAYTNGSNNSKPNSQYVFDASYLRIRNITLGYTLPKDILKKVGFINNVRLYASGQNLFTFNKDLPEGIDPQIPNGSTGNVYPIAITYTFGLNVTF